MIEQYLLKNKIPVYIVENSSSPVVSIQAWFTTGSVHETPKEAGISHFLEHALFKGTKKRDVGEVANEIESHGGEINAFTSFEQTVYYTTLASRYFKNGLDVIADMVQTPTFDSEEMEREKEVILEEIRRSEDSPYKVLSKNLWKLCFAGSQYGRPVIGYVDTVKKINAQKLKSYFSKNYNSGSLALFIVGDVDKEEVYKQCQKLFANVKKGTPKFRIPKINSTLKNSGFISEKKDIQDATLILGFRMPDVKSPLIPVMDLLCTAIGQGESSRIYQRLVKETQLAQDANLGLTATSGCGIASIDLTCSPDKLQAANEEMWKVIQEVAEKGLEDSEIERVKNSFEAEVVYGKETVEAYARRLGYYYCQFGDPNAETDYLDKLLSIEKRDLQEGLKYLLDQKPQFSMIHPLEHKPNEKAISDVWKKTPRVSPVSFTSVHSKPEKTDKGSITYITKKASHLPTIAMKFIFQGGSREDSLENLGLSHLFQKTWNSGTPQYNSFQIAHKLESLGASISSFAGRNTVGLNVECLIKHWPVVKDLFSQVLLEPTFAEEEVHTEKQLQLRDILTEKDSPAALCQLNFLNHMFPNHPNGRSQLGTEETVSRFSREDLKKYYGQFITQNNLIVSTVGNIHSSEWVAEIDAIAKKLPASGKSLTPYKTLTPPSKSQVVVAAKNPLFQSHLLIGFLGTSMTEKERYPLKLLSSVLSGQGGRLFLELRDKQSLAYSVSPIMTEGPEKGTFGFYIGCAPEKIEKAIKGIRIEIQKILEKAISSAELDRAKEYWLGRFDLDMQRNGAQAMVYGLDETYGLGYEHSQKIPEIIQGVTSKEIQEAAVKVFSIHTPTMSLVHPEPLDESRLIGYWG